ncbi:MAG: C40 family peptidase [Bacteroidales bacterium]|nr:C40 family peptidase [Bacteroidales bacterium]
MSAYGFCHLSVIPLREMPSDLSQMTSQLLFGDVFKVLAKEDDWIQIQNAFDDYIGWIDHKQQQPISLDDFDKLKQLRFTNDKMGAIKTDSDSYLVLPASSFPVNTKFNIGALNFEADFPLQPFLFNRTDELTKMALVYLNAPYLWGGKTPFGIDCSGFTQNVYKMAGIKLKRDAAQQATQGHTLSFLSEAKPGDLLFFDNADELITHVGILLNDNQIIHASGKVRIDRIDHQGIYNNETKRYTHKLRLIKTFTT